MLIEDLLCLSSYRLVLVAGLRKVFITCSFLSAVRILPKKRRSGGRKKAGSVGREPPVPCSQCGRLVPADKAIRVTRRYAPVEAKLARELEKDGAYVTTRPMVKYYCVSCAVHAGIVKVRSRNERKVRVPLQLLSKKPKQRVVFKKMLVETV